MTDMASLTHLALAVPVLTTAYWICLIVGGGLLIVSTVAGGDADGGMDADVSGDVDVDTDMDAGHAHASSLASWFSMHFVVYFMALFGLLGVTLTYLTEQSAAVILACALGAGIVAGQGVHQLLRKLRRSSGDSTPKPEDYLNKLGRVTVTVTSDKKGEVALRVGRAERFVPAVSKRADQTFQSGERVGVVGYEEGVLQVVSQQEYEFVTSK